MSGVGTKIKRQNQVLYTDLFWRRKFYKMGKRAVIEKPLNINNASCISIGDYSTICSGSVLADLDKKNKDYPKIKIGDHCSFLYRFHVILLYQ